MFGAEHGGGVHDLVGFFLGEDVLFDDDLANLFALFVGLFGEGGGFVIADLKGKGSDDGHGPLDEFLALLDVGFRALDGFLVEGDASTRQNPNGFEEGVSHHGFHDVEVEKPALTGNGHGGVLSHGPGSDLDHHLADDGVDFAGHDGTTGLEFRELDFGDGGAWPRVEEPQVIGNFHEADAEGVEGA